MPVNDAGATPTIVYASPWIRIDWPTADGLAAYSRFHNR